MTNITPKQALTALKWKAKDPMAGADSTRARRILRDFRSGIGLASGNMDFIMDITAQWLIAQGHDVPQGLDAQ